MKALKIIGIIILSLLLIGFITFQTLPDEAHISRSTTIAASPQTVYQELITFKNFNSWSPWADKDTATVYTYDGPALGVGAKMSWASENAEVGSGSMEIIEIRENELVKTSMRFEGFDSSPTASYIIEPVDGGTKLTWTYDEEELSGIAKVFGTMMDKFLGSDYESGLASLKSRIENAPKSSMKISVVNAPSFQYLGIPQSSPLELISTKMAQAYGLLIQTINQNAIEMTAPPIAVITNYSPDQIDYICGIPVTRSPSKIDKSISLLTMREALSIKCVFKGDYSATNAAHKAIDAYMQFANYEMSGNPWEEYVTDAATESDTSKWITNVYYPVK